MVQRRWSRGWTSSGKPVDGVSAYRPPGGVLEHQSIRPTARPTSCGGRLAPGRRALAGCWRIRPAPWVCTPVNRQMRAPCATPRPGVGTSRRCVRAGCSPKAWPCFGRRPAQGVARPGDPAARPDRPWRRPWLRDPPPGRHRHMAALTGVASPASLRSPTAPMALAARAGLAHGLATGLVLALLQTLPLWSALPQRTGTTAASERFRDRWERAGDQG